MLPGCTPDWGRNNNNFTSPLYSLLIRLQTFIGPKPLFMKRILSLLAISLIPMLALSQFEQKISVYLNVGMFSTFGAKTFMPD